MNHVLELIDFEKDFEKVLCTDNIISQNIKIHVFTCKCIDSSAGEDPKIFIRRVWSGNGGGQGLG